MRMAGSTEINAKSVQLELELWLSLAILRRQKLRVQKIQICFPVYTGTTYWTFCHQWNWFANIVCLFKCLVTQVPPKMFNSHIDPDLPRVPRDYSFLVQLVWTPQLGIFRPPIMESCNRIIIQPKGAQETESSLNPHILLQLYPQKEIYWIK